MPLRRYRIRSYDGSGDPFLHSVRFLTRKGAEHCLARWKRELPRVYARMTYEIVKVP